MSLSSDSGMPLQSIKFIATTSYGLISMVTYFFEIYVIFSRRHKFKGSFFSLFLAQSFLNCITYLNSFITLRLPQNTCQACLLASFFSAGDFPGLEIFHTIHYQMAFVQYLMIMAMSLNRFTMIIYPFNFEKLWKPMPVILLAVTVLPLLATARFLLNNSTYRYVLSTDWYAIVSTTDMGLFYKILIGHMIIVTSISILLNVATVITLMTRTIGPGIQKTELLLIFHSFVNFAIMLFATIITVFNLYGVTEANKEEWYAVTGQTLLPFVSDSLTLISPFLLIICSSSLRNAIAHTLTGKPSTPVVSISINNRQ